MKRMLLSALILAVCLPVSAQTEEPPELNHPTMDAAHHAIAEFLDLDQAQVDAWDILWADHRMAEEVLRPQIAEVQALIDDLFAAGVPDPTDLGLLVIERHDLGQELIDVHVIYIEGFQALLDEKQTRRLNQIRIADKIQRWIPAFKAFDLVKR